MAKVNVTTANGILVEILDTNDYGDMTKPLPQASFTNDLMDALKRAAQMENEER